MACPQTRGPLPKDQLPSYSQPRPPRPLETARGSSTGQTGTMPTRGLAVGRKQFLRADATRSWRNQLTVFRRLGSTPQAGREGVSALAMGRALSAAPPSIRTVLGTGRGLGAQTLNKQFPGPGDREGTIQLWNTLRRGSEGERSKKKHITKFLLGSVLTKAI